MSKIWTILSENATFTNDVYHRRDDARQNNQGGNIVKVTLDGFHAALISQEKNKSHILRGLGE